MFFLQAAGEEVKAAFAAKEVKEEARAAKRAEKARAAAEAAGEGDKAEQARRRRFRKHLWSLQCLGSRLQHHHVSTGWQALAPHTLPVALPWQWPRVQGGVPVTSSVPF